MDYLQTMYVLGVCSCFCWAKEEHVVFEAIRTKYNVGDTVILTCYVRSSWLSVSLGRNDSDLGNCYSILNGCIPSDDVKVEYGNYELKLEKSHPMLVIKNVTRDDDGANFTCHWTSYTATTSFAVTDKAVKMHSMPEENMSDSSVVPVTVIVSVLVPVIVLVIVIVVVRVRQPVLNRRLVEGIIDFCGRRIHHNQGQAPVNTDTVCVQEELVQTNTQTFSDVIGQIITKDKDFDNTANMNLMLNLGV